MTRWEKFLVRSGFAGRSDIVDNVVNEVMTLMDPYFNGVISPSGSPDALADPYYDPNNPEIAKLNNDIGNWVITGKVDGKSHVRDIEGTFFLDKDGEARHVPSMPYSTNKFGNDLKSGVAFMQALMKLFNQ
jgi:hypothetical protein